MVYMLAERPIYDGPRQGRFCPLSGLWKSRVIDVVDDNDSNGIGIKVEASPSRRIPNLLAHTQSHDPPSQSQTHPLVEIYSLRVPEVCVAYHFKHLPPRVVQLGAIPAANCGRATRALTHARGTRSLASRAKSAGSGEGANLGTVRRRSPN
jgi:hypothetical protein